MPEKEKSTDETSKSNIPSIEKKYTQFSKKVVTFCLINLIAAEVFVAVMICKSGDTSSLSYFLTSISIECLGCIIWYMKNSESEKVARINAEIEKEKLKSGDLVSIKESDLTIKEFDNGLSGNSYESDIPINSDDSKG